MKLNIDNLGLNRKLNKLKKDPELFVKDMIFKRTAQVKKYIPLKYEGNNKFTIVSAVYNVSLYLNEYFESIVKQSINFKKNIFIVCVDDGSTDNSAEIIKKWQKKYPNNIKYIYKENGGQASARNLGLEHVNTKWVTFTDPDDYLHPDYFKEIDTAIEQNKETYILAANLHFYIENENLVKDTHPLRRKFHQNESLFKINDLDLQLQLHASSTFFQTKFIINNHIKFDETIKPSFEDGKFLTDYLLYSPTAAQLKFVKKAIYLYRKRESGDSTLDGAWDKVGQYLDVFANGVLPMFEAYQAKFGVVPQNIQNIGLYHISWYLKRLINNQHKIAFLTNEQQVLFRKLIHQCFEYISEETILKFNLSDIWFFHKVGLLGLFKNTEPKLQITYVESIDTAKKQILVNYFYSKDHAVSFKFNEIDTIPTYEKDVNYTFNEELFVKEKRAWIPYENENDLFTIIQNNMQARITVKGKQHLKGIRVKEILEKFKPSQKYNSDNSWLLMDRNTHADDNAEHLYRYIQKNHPEQEIVFAISKESSDWERLKAENFNLVDFGSIEFELALRKCSKIISSHLDQYVFNYFGDHYEFSKKFIFLQHGVTKDNLSTWFNTKKGLTTLVTSTKPEYESIAGNNNNYKLTEKEVILTGFPRHDSLLFGNITDSKKILVMPTWRDNVVGKIIGKNGERQFNTQFLETEYAKHWCNFLKSDQLKQLIDQYGYEISFFPHPLIKPYLEVLQLPNYIDVVDGEISIQALFKTSDFLITDYSSVAFEFGFLHKTVLYYQFDHEEVFSGAHTYSKGYFDYIEHGFGPVVFDQGSLLNELETTLQNNGKPQPNYLYRMEATYTFRDGNNSKRVYDHLIWLDSQEEVEIKKDILSRYINNAENVGDTSLLKSRYQLWLDTFTEQSDEIKFKLGTILLENKNWQELSDLMLDFYQLDWDVELQFAQKNWTQVVALLKEQDHLTNEQGLLLLFCLIQLSEYDSFNEYFNLINFDQEEFKSIAEVFFAISEQQWDLVLKNISKIDKDTKLFNQYQLSIFEAIANRKNGGEENTSHLIHNLKNVDPENTFFLLEKAKVHFNDAKYKEALYFFDKLYNKEKLEFFRLSTLEQYAQTLINRSQWEKLHILLVEWLELYPNSDILKQSYTNVLFELKMWTKLVEINNSNISTHAIILANYRLGHIDKSYNLMVQPTYTDTYEYWLLVLEICLQKGNKTQAFDYFRSIIAIFPEKANEAHKKYIQLQEFLKQEI